MTIANPISGKVDDQTTISAAEANAIGVACASAVDGVGGGTFTPSSAITFGGSGIIITAASSFSANLTCSSGGSLTVASGGTVRFQSGSNGIIESGSTVTCNSGGHLTCSAGSVVSLAGGTTIPSGGSLTCNAGSTIALSATVTQPGGTVTFSDFTMSSTNNVKLASRSITRVQDKQAPLFLASEFTASASAPMGYTDTATGKVISFPLHVPHGAALTAVSITIDPPNAHGGAVMPTTPATLEIVRLSGGTEASVGTQVDVGPTATYEAKHDLTVSGISDGVLNRATAQYFARLTTETGGTAISGTLVYPILKVTYTTTGYEED